MIEPLLELLDDVSARWSKVSGKESFSSFALSTLRQMPPLTIDWNRVDELVLGTPLRTINGPGGAVRVSTVGGGFGDIEISLSRASDSYYLQLVFWATAKLDIHSHSFTGAFRVVQGGSVHATCEWTDVRRVSKNMMVGNCRLKALDLLRPGDCCEILGGLDFMHGLLHVGLPSVTLVLRSRSEDALSPQFGLSPRSLHSPPPHAATAGVEMGLDGTGNHIRGWWNLHGQRGSRATAERALVTWAEQLEPEAALDVRRALTGRAPPAVMTALDARIPEPFLSQEPTAFEIRLRDLACNSTVEVERVIAGALMFGPNRSEVTRIVSAHQPHLSSAECDALVWRVLVGFVRQWLSGDDHIVEGQDDEDLADVAQTLVDSLRDGVDVDTAVASLADLYDEQDLQATMGSLKLAYEDLLLGLGRFSNRT